MTEIGTIRRVWPGARAVVIARVPVRVLRYEDQGDDRPPFVVLTEREQQYYVWTSDTHGKLMASLCERAAETKQRVALTWEPCAWGHLLTDATLVESES